MHRRAFLPAQFFAVSLLALIGMGCGQAEGERCQVDSDCNSGLTCQDRQGSSPFAENGICRSSTASSKTDAGIKSDTSTSMTPDSSVNADTTLAKDVAPDLVSKVDLRADSAQASDTAVDVPQTADAAADAQTAEVLHPAESSDARVD